MAPLTLRSGPWSSTQITDHLKQAAIPLRLATAGTFPLVQSLWFHFDGSSLWCATQADSVVACRIAREANVGFEVAPDTPPYRGVRGTGHATIDAARGPDILELLIDRYLGTDPTPLGAWLMSRASTEVAIRITDLTVTSWDYSARM